jgi:hypothetical protein
MGARCSIKMGQTRMVSDNPLHDPLRRGRLSFEWRRSFDHVCSCGKPLVIEYAIEPEHDGHRMLGGHDAWNHWVHLVDSGLLLAMHRGSDTYGHVDLYIEGQALAQIRRAQGWARAARYSIPELRRRSDPGG